MKQNHAVLRLKKGRDESLKRKHPWVFSGAIADAPKGAAPGETVDVLSADGQWIGRGAWSPQSQIRVRMWTFLRDEQIGPAFFRNRIGRALALRQASIPAIVTDSMRLVNGESDGLPGIIIDRYTDFLVGQFLSTGAETHKGGIVQQAMELTGAKGFFERSDGDSRAKEGLLPAVGLLTGEEPPDFVKIHEHGLRYLVDVRKGHKTGFYLDQRDNRAALSAFTKKAEVLNVFAYTGGFGLMAAKGGASRVVQLDSSADVLDIARRNEEINRFPSGRLEYLSEDAFKALRRFRDEALQFDVVILDPPKFASSAAQVERAARGYKDINLLAFKLLRPGGTLFTFSCSGHLLPPLFQKIVADAALDAGRDTVILHSLSQAPDHPIGLSFPEGHYLKGLIVRAN